MRGADALAQALDLLANHRGISHDRRLGDHARVMQVEVARAAVRLEDCRLLLCPWGKS